MNTRITTSLMTPLMGVLFFLLFFPPQPIQAQGTTASPVVVTAKTVPIAPGSSNYCVSLSYGAADADTFTRDSLGAEWFPSDGNAALKAGAVLIRSVVVFWSKHPIGNNNPLPWCNNQPHYWFTMLSTKVAGYNPGKGARDDRGTCWNQPAPCNVPVDRVTDTGGQVALRNGILSEFHFNDAIQIQTNVLAGQGKTYKQILKDPSIYNALTCNDTVSATPQPCGVALTVSSAAPNGYAFTPSMTNSNAPFYTFGAQPPFDDAAPPLGEHDLSSTFLNFAREAEQYWGYWGVTIANLDVDHPPPPEPGTYLFLQGRGAKGEYPVEFDGAYTNHVRISGIDDNPGPVLVNVYVNGYFQFQMGWYTADDDRRQINRNLPPLPSPYDHMGIHTVAIEFLNDFYIGPGCPYPTDQCDRKAYIAKFLVTDY